MIRERERERWIKSSSCCNTIIISSWRAACFARFAQTTLCAIHAALRGGAVHTAAEIKTRWTRTPQSSERLIHARWMRGVSRHGRACHAARASHSDGIRCICRTSRCSVVCTSEAPQVSARTFLTEEEQSCVFCFCQIVKRLKSALGFISLDLPSQLFFWLNHNILVLLLTRNHLIKHILPSFPLLQTCGSINNQVLLWSLRVIICVLWQPQAAAHWQAPTGDMLCKFYEWQRILVNRLRQRNFDLLEEAGWWRRQERRCPKSQIYHMMDGEHTGFTSVCDCLHY